MASVTSEEKPVEWADASNPHVLWGYVEGTVGHATLTAEDTSEALDVDNFPANAIPLHAIVTVGAYFTGGSVSDTDVEIGDSGDPNGLLTATNIFDGTKGSPIVAAGVEAEGGSTGPVLESAYSPQVLVTTTSDNVVNLDAGFLTFRIYYKRFDFSRQN